MRTLTQALGQVLQDIPRCGRLAVERVHGLAGCVVVEQGQPVPARRPPTLVVKHRGIADQHGARGTVGSAPFLIRNEL